MSGVNPTSNNTSIWQALGRFLFSGGSIAGLAGCGSGNSEITRPDAGTDAGPDQACPGNSYPIVPPSMVSIQEINVSDLPSGVTMVWDHEPQPAVTNCNDSTHNVEVTCRFDDNDFTYTPDAQGHTKPAITLYAQPNDEPHCWVSAYNDVAAAEVVTLTQEQSQANGLSWPLVGPNFIDDSDECTATYPTINSDPVTDPLSGSIYVGDEVAISIPRDQIEHCEVTGLDPDNGFVVTFMIEGDEYSAIMGETDYYILTSYPSPGEKTVTLLASHDDHQASRIINFFVLNEPDTDTDSGSDTDEIPDGGTDTDTVTDTDSGGSCGSIVGPAMLTPSPDLGSIIQGSNAEFSWSGVYTDCYGAPLNITAHNLDQYLHGYEAGLDSVDDWYDGETLSITGQVRPTVNGTESEPLSLTFENDYSTAMTVIFGLPTFEPIEVTYTSPPDDICYVDSPVTFSFTPPAGSTVYKFWVTLPGETSDLESYEFEPTYTYTPWQPDLHKLNVDVYTYTDEAITFGPFPFNVQPAADDPDPLPPPDPIPDPDPPACNAPLPSINSYPATDPADGNININDEVTISIPRDQIEHCGLTGLDPANGLAVSFVIEGDEYSAIMGMSDYYIITSFASAGEKTVTLLVNHADGQSSHTINFNVQDASVPDPVSVTYTCPPDDICRVDSPVTFSLTPPAGSTVFKFWVTLPGETSDMESYEFEPSYTYTPLQSGQHQLNVDIYTDTEIPTTYGPYPFNVE
ncbi:hypothetical protein ACFL1W_00450 [Candidatus Margulisiibacteriota bacterium]